MAVESEHLNEQALRRLDRTERFNLFGLTLPYLGLVSLLIIIPIGFTMLISRSLKYIYIYTFIAYIYIYI